MAATSTNSGPAGGSVSRRGDSGSGQRPRRRWALWIGVPVLALVLLVGAAVAFAGPLLRPIVEARASAALGRAVSIGRLHIRPGRIVTITADDLTIANPAGPCCGNGSSCCRASRSTGR
jgi:hypothetical protein